MRLRLCFVLAVLAITTGLTLGIVMSCESPQAAPAGAARANLVSDARTPHNELPASALEKSATGPAVLPSHGSQTAAAVYAKGPLGRQFRDSGFDSFVSMRRVGEALNSMDAKCLTDLALQLAEGERVLARPHASGITAQALMKRALFLASRTHDPEALERLSRTAGRFEDKSIAEVAKAALRIPGGSDTPHPDLMVSIEKCSPATVHSFHDALKRITRAKLLDHPDELEGCRTQIAALGLPEGQKKYLRSILDEGPDGRMNPDEASEALRKLAGATRDGGAQNAMQGVLTDYCRQIIGQFGGWTISDGPTIQDNGDFSVEFEYSFRYGPFGVGLEHWCITVTGNLRTGTIYNVAGGCSTVAQIGAEIIEAVREGFVRAMQPLMDQWRILVGGGNGQPGNSPGQRLPIDLNAWCKAAHGPSAFAVLKIRNVYGWICRVNAVEFPIDVQAAARMQYGANVKAAFADQNDPNSWYAYRP